MVKIHSKTAQTILQNATHQMPTAGSFTLYSVCALTRAAGSFGMLCSFSQMPTAGSFVYCVRTLFACVLGHQKTLFHAGCFAALACDSVYSVYLHTVQITTVCEVYTIRIFTIWIATTCIHVTAQRGLFDLAKLVIDITQHQQYNKHLQTTQQRSLCVLLLSLVLLFQ